jgi:RNA polymerase sigma-70 factor (ECF subfamily)
MTDANGALKDTLVERYEYLLGHLTRRLQSAELARDALHDTYLRLGRIGEIPSVSKPLGYLLRIAMNLARDRQRSSRRLASMAEIETVLDLVDGGPDPGQTAEMRSEFRAFELALTGLSPRRRAILLASFNEDLPSREIARQFGLSTRMIDRELKLAREYCARVLLKPVKK